jgi:hypothetical protein
LTSINTLSLWARVAAQPPGEQPGEQFALNLAFETLTILPDLATYKGLPDSCPPLVTKLGFARQCGQSL